MMWSDKITQAEQPKDGDLGTEADAELLAIVNDFSGLANLPDSEPSFANQAVSVAHTSLSVPFPELNHDDPPTRTAGERVDVVGDLVAQALSSASATSEAQNISVIQKGPRADEIRQMRSELFTILADDPEFPEFHARAILDLASRVSDGTPESELRDLWTLILYFVETLGVLLDKERQWGESKDSYLAAVASKSKPQKFYIRAIQMLSRSSQTRAEESPEMLAAARKAFERDYSRWKKRFIVLLKRYWAVSSTKFRIDFSDRPYAWTVEQCLNAAFSLWEKVHLEYQKIQQDLSKLRGNVLAEKIARIEREFDFSDLEAELQRAADLEAARNGTYRPRPRR